MVSDQSLTSLNPLKQVKSFGQVLKTQGIELNVV